MNGLLVIGITIVVGIIGAKLIGKLKLPSVVGWLIVGAILGPSISGLFTTELLSKLDFISDITLGLIGFILGTEITIGALRKLGGGIAAIIFTVAFGAFALVFLGVLLLTHNLPLALIFGALAPASAPAGTVAVLEEYKARGPLTKALYIVVGVDDALAIIIFVFAISYAKVLIGGANLSLFGMIGKPLLEIAMAIGIGGVIGWVFGFLMRKTRENKILLPALLGTVFICIGLSKVLHFSLILVTMVFGMVMVNSYPRVCGRISKIMSFFMSPIYICFFALAGAHLNLSLLSKVGILGIIYIVLRTIGKMIGSWLGATIGKEPPVIRKYLGFGLWSQAGVAIGLAYLIVREFTPLGILGQEIATTVITVIAATTIIFEIVGPIATKFAITKANEIGRKS